MMVSGRAAQLEGWQARVTARSAARPLTVGLLGLIGCGNTGNDASFEAMVAFLRRVVPEARLLCVSAAPDVTRADYGIDAVPLTAPPPGSHLGRVLERAMRGLPRRLRTMAHALQRMRELDIVIVPGTGILDDFGTGPLGMPLTLLTWCAAARLRGARLALVSIGAGPIRHPMSRRLMRAAAGLAHYRSYRDKLSKEFMLAIGFPAQLDRVYPDLAFGLDMPATPEPMPGEALTVGIGVMTYYGWRNDAAQGEATYSAYVAMMTEFVRWLLASGYRVRVLTGDAADARALEDLRARLAATMPGSEQVSFALAGSLHDVLDEIARCQLVVATRFHNIVAALKLARPTISLGYARKNDVLMADMGLADYCRPIEQADLAWLKERFTRLAGDRARHAASLRERNVAYRRALAEQEELLGCLLPVIRGGPSEPKSRSTMAAPAEASLSVGTNGG